MKLSENYKNITESTPPPHSTLRQDGDPRHYTPQPQPVHKPNMTHKTFLLQGITIGPKQITKPTKLYSGTSEAQKPTLTK